MSTVAYLRNGVKGDAISYFTIQPSINFTPENALITNKVQQIPISQETFSLPLIPSAVHQPFSRKVLGLKPSPFSIRTGMDPGPKFQGAKALQGYGRHQNKGLAFMLDGKDHVSARPLLVQADSSYAGMNNRIPLPP